MDLDAAFREGEKLTGAGDHEGAAKAYEAVLAASPNEPECLWRYAECCLNRRQFERGAGVARRAIAYRPNYAVAWGCLGSALGFLGEHAAAGEALEEALRLAPDMPAARWNYALWLLADGRWREGWQQYRWGVVSRARRMRTLAPPWDGRPLDGTLFVWAEQGQGDAINFSRFLPAARARCGRLVFEVQEPLVGLLADHPGADLVVTQQLDGSIPCRWEAHVPLMDLPGVLGVDTPEQLEQYPPCLPEPPAVTVASGDGLKVGVCRRGSPDHPHDFARSLPAEALAPLLAVPGCTFISLVPGEAPPAGMAAMPPVTSWEGTQALLAGLDLIVSVDTAVAHLAASMPKPTWLLLAKPTDFRWLIGRTDTPWYPNARLFRQQVCGEWGPVVEQVTDRLKRWNEMWGPEGSACTRARDDEGYYAMGTDPELDRVLLAERNGHRGKCDYCGKESERRGFAGPRGWLCPRCLPAREPATC